MKHAILVSGPNASGKTTSTQRALAPWVGDPRLVAVYADNSDRKAFKGTQTEMEDRLLALWEQDAEVLVVEGTNRIAMAFARVTKRSDTRTWESNIMRVPPWFLKWALQTRCEKLGKRFRDDYWVEKVLVYETQKRFKVIDEKHLSSKTEWWEIGDGYHGQERFEGYLRNRLWALLGEPIEAKPDVVAVDAPSGSLF